MPSRSPVPAANRVLKIGDGSFQILNKQSQKANKKGSYSLRGVLATTKSSP